jgi:hypothetical protein
MILSDTILPGAWQMHYHAREAVWVRRPGACQCAITTPDLRTLTHATKPNTRFSYGIERCDCIVSIQRG